MRITFLAFFAIMILQPSLYANVITVDCGEGFIGVTSTNNAGLSTVECRKLWCRDLENGRSMGSGNNPANGYQNTANPVSLDEYVLGPDEYIYCFGERRWCPNEARAMWYEDAGIFIREIDLADIAAGKPVQYRSQLSGNCYRWQGQSHGCPAGTIAHNDGTAWICLTPGMGVNQAKSATTPASIRRAPVAPQKLR